MNLNEPLETFKLDSAMDHFRKLKFSSYVHLPLDLVNVVTLE